MKSALQQQILNTLDLYRDMLVVQERAIAEEDPSRIEETLKRIHEYLSHLHALKRAFDKSPEKISQRMITTGETIRKRYEEVRALQAANDAALTEKTAILKARASRGSQLLTNTGASVFRPAEHGGNMVDLSV